MLAAFFWGGVVFFIGFAGAAGAARVSRKLLGTRPITKGWALTWSSVAFVVLAVPSMIAVEWLHLMYGAPLSMKGTLPILAAIGVFFALSERTIGGSAQAIPKAKISVGVAASPDVKEPAPVLRVTESESRLDLPVPSSTELTVTHVDDDEDKLWEMALGELDNVGSDRRRGLWARCFAEAGGNDAAARAAYLNARVQEYKAGIREKADAAGKAKEQRAESGRAIRDKLMSDQELSVPEVEALVQVADLFPEVIHHVNRLNGNTLLHLSARRGLPSAVSRLIALGANVDARNGSGRRADELALSDEVRLVMRERPAK